MPNTTVYGTFSYNTSTDTFTSESLSFVGNSIFDGLSGTVTQPQYGNTFVFDKTVDGYTVSYTIVLNPMNRIPILPTEASPTAKPQGHSFNTRCRKVARQLSYLAASGLVLFAGILLAGKQRRQLAEN